jgi:hypothetical protein
MNRCLLFGLLTFTMACQTVAPTSAPESTRLVPTRTPAAPATVPPTLTPTLALSPTPIPLFFVEEFDSDLSPWASFQTGGESAPETRLGDGTLVVRITSPHTWYYAVHSAHDYADVRVDARFESISNGPGSLGLICRYSESGGWYEFNVSSDGTYSVLLGQWLAQGIARYTPIAYDPSEYLQPGLLNYELGLVCQEDFLLLHINDKLFRKLDVSRYGLEGGRVGIAAASFDDVPMTALFEWVSVSQP